MKGTIEKHELLKYGEDSIPGKSINVQGFPYDTNVRAVYCPHQHNQNREHFEAFFLNVRAKIYSWKQLQQQTHTMGDHV